MNTWPATLPALPLREGFTATDRYAVTRTSDKLHALARQRERDVMAWGGRKFTLTLNGEQREALWSFYLATLSRGVFRFNWSDPVSGETVQARFEAPPKVRARGAERFSAELTLEILP